MRKERPGWSDGFTRRKNPRRNYHLQGDVLKDSITGYLKYIVDHDAFRLKHPLPKPKKEHKKGTKAYI